ncbi:hypothetical protein Slin15195_G063650 [Septoria linicola]|uniref:Ca2+-modulated nonselective cation channel polycystin n=1 Tax=Septoria linicola TaxID=215465 RepID=A0A9Q9AWD7_9PEZI|nr:hypothetical protein Slin14017_G113960 [Septoria linicola]USW53046.1 hypothetical protein Slin15195_G063650 [Septoria linicola]
MRSAFLYLIQLAAALPLPQRSMPTISRTTKDVEIIDVNLDNAWTKFAVSPGYKDPHTELTTSPLIFELEVHQASDLISTNITLNEQQLDVKWDTTVADGTFFATFSSPSTQVLTISDDQGTPHFVDISLSGYIPVDWTLQPLREPADTQHLSLRVLSVDEFSVKHFELDIVSHATSPDKRLRKLYRVSDMHPTGSDARKAQLLSADTVIDTNPFADQHHSDDRGDELDIEAEIESLLQLEAQAGDLSAQIVAKKQGISKCLKDHRENVSLGHLLRQCDGVVCAAKVIAQRICDKMGVETMPNFNYVQMQDPNTQQLIQLHDTEQDTPTPRIVPSARVKNGTLAGDGSFNLHSSGAAVRQSMEIIYPQSMLYRVLGIIACACGLTALFSFIRRKCMSARRMVDELAEREERRNARAYRRAARRADMRKRWENFLRSVNCFSMRGEEPRIENYEEKRALILQDAFLEQDIDIAEKGEVMEAEIRELRHAHEIVSSLIRVDEHRYDLAPRPDPPPPLVPLPSGRSRASTATLPSYTSELLPDYRSRISAMSTTIASSSSSVNGSTEYSPSSSTGDGEDVFTAADTGSTPRSFSPDGSTGTRRSRMTEISSIIEISPRASEETLRTFQRSSMAWSRRSRDTNDL